MMMLMMMLLMMMMTTPIHPPQADAYAELHHTTGAQADRPEPHHTMGGVEATQADPNPEPLMLMTDDDHDDDYAKHAQGTQTANHTKPQTGEVACLFYMHI